MYPYGDERSPRSRTGLEAARSRPMPDLSVAEFAALKGVTTRTVRKWIAAGYVKAERVGPKHLFVVMLSAPTSRTESTMAPVGAATRTIPAPTNGQPSAGRNGGGKAEVVVVGGTDRLPSAALGGDASRSRASALAKRDLNVLRTRVDEAARDGRRVTGGDVAIWLGVSQRTGRRRLADLLASNPELAQRIAPP